MQSGDSAMQTANKGKSSNAEAAQRASEPEDLSRLDPAFVVAKARKSRTKAGEVEEGRKSGRRAKGIARKSALAEHHDALSWSIQSFIKFFLGNPDKPQDYPITPTEPELAGQYWMEKQSAVILQQLDRVRAALVGKPAAEIDYYVGVAEKEIRKNLTLPPFTSASMQGPGKGCKPISLPVKADVERTLALAGICRVTFQWDATQPGSSSAWNSAIIEILALKSAAQAPAIIQRWIHTKLRELREFQNMDVPTYNGIKNRKAKVDQHQRMRKKIKENQCSMVDKLFQTNIQLANIVEQRECGSDIEDAGENIAPLSQIPDWRSDDLTSILHCLDKMTIARGQHHKTVAANQKLYARSKRNFKSTKGII
ncbi:hypothetical protein PTTG_30529, partial [Puccinia triticina 1-1 BBBD Race 1]